MGKEYARQSRKISKLGGAAKGMNSLSGHMLRPGEVSILDNFIHRGNDARSRLGWKTFESGGTEGALRSWSFDGTQTGGLNGGPQEFMGHAMSDDSKMIVFDTNGMLVNDTDLDFTGAASFRTFDPSSWGFTSNFIGVLFFAETFLVYTKNELMSWRSDIGNEIFNGSGLDDMDSNSSSPGQLDNSKTVTFLVKIDSTGTPDTFKWSIDGGTSWVKEGVEITGSAQKLSDGVEVTFAADTGHTLDDEWTVLCQPITGNAGFVKEVDFAKDIGFEYGPILGIFARFGQLWVVTKQDRIFWSTVLKYKITGGDPINDQSLEKEWTVWQSVTGGPIFSMDDVEYMAFFKANVWSISTYPIESGSNHCSVDGSLSDWSTGDIVYPEGESETNQIASGGLARPVTVPHTAVTAGDGYINIPKDGDENWKAFIAGRLITITEGATTEQLTSYTSVDYGAYIRVNLFGSSTWANSYTVAAVVELETMVHITFTSNWNANYSVVHLVKDVWTDLPITDYDVSLDPDSDPNADGHIRFKETSTVTNAEGLRCTYTPVDNAWTGGSSGAWDIAASKGDNIAFAEGPNAREEEGAGLIYLFKTNGDIHAITGRPGFDGGPGSIDAKVIATGIIARANTPKVTREGLYFGAIDGIRYDIYFLPHGVSVAGEEQIPIINETFELDGSLPLDDSSYTVKEKSFVFGGDKYLIFFPNYQGSDFVSKNDYLYTGRAVKERGGATIGQWSRMNDSAVDNYQANNNKTVDFTGSPMTMGFYYHKGTLVKVYAVSTGHQFALGTSRYYELATYGWRDGGEECKDKYVYTYNAGGGSYTTERSTDYFSLKILHAMIRLAEKINVRKLFIDQDIIGGTDTDGIKFTYDLFSDLDYNTSIFSPSGSKAINNLTDDTTGLKLLVEIDLNFKCKYFQLSLQWDNVKYRDKPARIIYRDSAVEFAVLSDKGVLAEEENN